VTALLTSVKGLDFTETPNGSVLDLRLHPSSTVGAAGLAAMRGLVRTFFAPGGGVSPGYALQFDVVDTETLLAAQRTPQDYGSLQVRVAGYSAYFVQLSRAIQDQLIAQSRHSI
jgi:formate C-acetyltransferase